MIAEKIKEVFERDYLPILREICDEVEIEVIQPLPPLSKRGIQDVTYIFNCYDKVGEERNCFRWKGDVIIWQRKEVENGVVKMEGGELQVEGIQDILCIRTWNGVAERKVRCRLNFFVSRVLAETIAYRFGLKCERNVIQLKDGGKVKIKFSPKETILEFEVEPKKVALRNLSGAELLKALTQIVSLFLL
jgi:hypothetical protein